MADVFGQGRKPEYLYWVGCAGAFDHRYKKVARAFAKILNHFQVEYAVLGPEESCTGDPARRAGNEMLFQMQALANIEILNGYEVKKIVTICPHCFNIFKNEYPALGGDYEVIHYTQMLDQLIKEHQVNMDGSPFQNKRVTFHDPCYLGRGNDIYEAPRNVLNSITSEMVEMPRHKSHALCCGAGGAQMFKEAEEGDKEIFLERTEEALNTRAEMIATSCPFCLTMLYDGVKYKNREAEIRNIDLAELVAEALKL